MSSKSNKSKVAEKSSLAKSAPKDAPPATPAPTQDGLRLKHIGVPKAVRAVALANRSNPIGVVPCHRVIGSDGSLTGYGGGLSRKRWLLEHEARHCAFRLEVSE